MAQAKEGDTVKVHYSSKLIDGVIIDSSEGADPLEFKIGSGHLIPGFEEAVIGMSPGESKTVRVPPEKAYGLYRDDKVIEVDLKDLPSDIKPEVGMNLEVCGSDGKVIPVQITEIVDNKATLDANHPLAEQELIFDIKLIEIAKQF